MNIVVTGSLGHISRPLTRILIAKGHNVTVVSSAAERETEIRSMGATPAIGKMQDAGFLTHTFKGADVVYLMEAVGHHSFFNPDFDIYTEIAYIVSSYMQAVETSGVKKIIHLSSIGAHTDKGNGLLAFHYHAEKILNTLPDDVAIKFMRPVGFY